MNRVHFKFLITVLVSMLSVALMTGCGSEPLSNAGAMTSKPDGDLHGESIKPALEENVMTTVEQGIEQGLGQVMVPVPEQVGGPDVPVVAAASGLIEFVAQLFIASEEGISGPSIVGNAQFSRIITPTASSPLLRPMRALDTCEISSEVSQINVNSLNYPTDHMLDAADNMPIQLTSVEAGQSVELASDGNTYLSLTPDALFADSKKYTQQTGAQMTTAVPDSLSASVAGADFPALEWQWNKPQLLTADLRLAVRSALTNPEMVWRAAVQSDAVQSRLLLHAGYISELNGDFQSFQCELSDDGFFILPTDIQALFENGFVPHFVDVARYTRSLQVVDGVSIVNVFVQKM